MMVAIPAFDASKVQPRRAVVTFPAQLLCPSGKLGRALDAATIGPIHPLHGVWRNSAGDILCRCGNPACEHPGKHPASAHGFQDATSDPETIKQWWQERPSCNIGLRTGHVVVLDVDRRHGGDRTLNELESQHGLLPLTWVSVTGDGWHIYFLQPDGPPLRCGNLGPGLEVKGLGTYITAPGSTHFGGKVYEWDPDYHPNNMPIAKLPQWVAERFLRTSSSRSSRSAGLLGRLGDNRRVPTGERREALLWLSGVLFGTRLFNDRNLVLALVWGFAQEFCAQTPPITEKSVQEICKWTFEQEARRRGAAR